MRIIYFRSLSYGVPIWVYFCFTLSREKYIDFNSFGSQKKLLCGFCVRESVTVSVTMIARETVRENGVIKWVLIKFFRYFGNKTQSSADKQKKIGTESNCSPFADQSQMYSMRSTAYVFAHWEWSCLGALRAQKLQKMVSLFWNF